jgi:hyperosmotically inducible periplasmic protein
MKSLNKLNLQVSCSRIFLTTFLMTTIGLTGCEKDSTDVAKEKIERSADIAQQNIEDSKEVAKDKIDDLKSRVDTNTELRKDQIDQSAESSKEALEKHEEMVEKNADKASEKVEQIEENKKERAEDMKDSANPSFMDDAMITTKVKAALVTDPSLSASDIQVKTNEGIVQLSGSVTSDLVRTKAVEIAKAQENVKDVVSSIVVVSAPPAYK